MTNTPRKNFTVRYTGPSMRPTLQPGDLLTVEEECRRLLIGDIIVFRDDEGQSIVHRIVAMDQAGVKTKGDNNSEPDAGTVDRERLIGRVTAMVRGKRIITIRGGFLSGRAYRGVLLALKRCEWFLVRRLHPLYRGIAQFSWPQKVFGALLKPRFLYFNKPEGAEIQMLIDRRVIGRYLQAENGWQIRRPYRLLINETTLPRLTGGGWPKAG